jgi:FdhD protein
MRQNQLHENSQTTPNPVRDVDAVRISTKDSRLVREHCQVVVEQPFTVVIEGVGSYTLMVTPSDLAALALGFAFSEGIVTDLGEVHILSQCEEDPNVIHLHLANPPQDAAARNLIVASSCGLCGSQNLDEILHSLAKVDDTLGVSGSFLVSLSQQMRSMQDIFTQTGGAHAAALFSADGGIVAFAEDIGRHNALDKAIGKCLLAKASMKGKGVMLSGRISLELVLKAARARIEVIAAVSAPSSLAVEVAERCNITLCGFVREDRATIYTHPERTTDVG